ncbi:MAG: hypothetical protein Fur002_18170 [Anaerolineales bacterium]
MNDYSQELLKNGIIEAKAKNYETARRYLDRAIYMAGRHDVLSEAWFWMSEISADAAEKRKALENCLALDLQHARARRALAVLDGKLQAEEMIDPDHLPPAPSDLIQADAQRLMCPKCGGRMSFAPDGQKLTCEYCARGQTLSGGAAAEKDFIVAMATKRGHGKPLQEQVFHCKGCGAEFLLPPKQISAACAYCNSPHVVSVEKSKEFLAPDGILPYAFDQKRAVKILIDWVEGRGFKPEAQVELPRGLYLPLWTFDIGGAIDYAYEYIDRSDEGYQNSRQPRKVRVQDSFPVLADDVPIPASRKASGVFVKLISSYDLSALRPYDPRYFAGMMAELYDIPMAEASLDARSQTYEKYKNELPHVLNNANIVHTSSAKLLVDSFKLNLLPVWMTELPFGGREHLLLINGQSGVVASEMLEEKEEGGSLWNWLGDLLE